MDFLDPKKKRAHNIRLYVGYVLMTIALGIGSFILLMQAYGYDVNRKTGGIIQNGMVFVDAHPEQARVFVNGQQETETSARLMLPEGKYTIKMTRDGYRSWERTFALLGSKIERLDYAFLFPDKLEPEDVQLYAKTPVFSAQSPDRRWLLTLQPGNLNSFDVVDLGDENNATKTINLPTALLTTAKGNQSYELVEWSTDNRHVLLRHIYQGGDEFVVIDHEEPELSYNVNKTFNFAPAKVALRDKKFDKLHLLEKPGGSLYFGDVAAKTRTVVATSVRAFKSYGDDVLLYVSDDPTNPQRVNAQVLRGKTTYPVRSLPVGKGYLVDISKYKGHWYLAVATEAEKQAYIYKDVFDKPNDDQASLPGPVAALRLNAAPQHVSFSANTRFIGLQSGSEFAVYDAEHDRQYRYDTKLKLTAGYEALWMDGHRYMVVSEGKLHVFDYDGVNHQELVGSQYGRVFFDRDYDNLYSVGASALVKDRSALVKTPMRIATDR